MSADATGAAVAVRAARPADRPALTALATFILFTLFAGNFWRNLLTWWGWGALAVVVIGVAVTWLVRERARVHLRTLPLPLLGFVALCTASIAWSAYPAESALGVAVLWLTAVVALPLALFLSWSELLSAFSAAMRWIVGLSVIFELIVAFIIRQPILPLYIQWTSAEDAPLQYLWSRNLLLAGGKIQGIQGNSIALAGCAVLALVALAVQLADRRIRRGPGWVWMAVSAGVLALTQSVSILVGALAAVVVAGAALTARRYTAPQARFALAGAALAATGGALLAVWTWREQFLDLVGKSSDLTGRLEIWSTVSELAVQRPAFGWGWVGYWTPWREPFDDLVIRSGVVQLHAHSAWVDVWFQLGFVGLAFFTILVASTIVRAWWAAIDRPRLSASEYGAHTALSLFPLLMLTVLVVQSFAESRLLIEEGWLTLVLLTVGLRARAFDQERA